MECTNEYASNYFVSPPAQTTVAIVSTAKVFSCDGED